MIKLFGKYSTLLYILIKRSTIVAEYLSLENGSRVARIRGPFCSPNSIRKLVGTGSTGQCQLTETLVTLSHSGTRNALPSGRVVTDACGLQGYFAGGFDRRGLRC